MLQKKLDPRRILLSTCILMTIAIFMQVGTVRAIDYITYYPRGYSIGNGTYFSGSLPTSLESVDSDYFTAASSPSATSASTHNPSAYNLFGGTTHVSGTVADLSSDNDVHMVYGSYPIVTSAQNLYAHQEAATIGGSPYYLQKPESADLTGTNLSASMATLGRQLIGKFVYPLAGINTLPASTLTAFYRTWRDPDPRIVYDSVGSRSNGDGAANITWSHMVGSGPNRFMMIGVAIKTETVSVLGVTVGAQSATFLRSDTRVGEVKGEIWYLINPSPGAKTVTVTLSGISKACGGSVSYTGVDQSSPIDNHQAVLYGGTNPSVSLTTTVANDWIFSNLAISGTATTTGHGSGQVHRFYEVGTGGSGTSRAGVDGDDKPTIAPGLQVMSWNTSFWVEAVVQAVAFKPASPPVGHVDVDILMLKSDGAVRANITTHAANSVDLTSAPTTLSGTYSWAAYNSVNQTDYLEIDYYADVVSGTSGASAYLRIDDSALAATSQTRIGNVMLPSEYAVEVELTGSANMYSWTQLQWTVDCAWTAGSVTVTLQLYDYTLGAYPTVGNGMISFTSNATANTDETTTQTIASNPSRFRDAGGNWRIKIKGVRITDAQFDLKADWIELRPTYYIEYTVSTEFQFLSMTDKTPTQLNFTVTSDYDVTGVAVTIQVWNYSSSAYVSSGQGYLKYTSFGANETRLISINENPESYTLNGSARIRLTGVFSTTAQYQQRTNLVRLDYGGTTLYVHDVAVVSVSTSAIDVVPGQAVTITVIVRNNGNATETFSVTVFRNETLIETRTVTSVAPDAQQALEFTWNTTGISGALYGVRAEASAVSGEVDTANNVYDDLDLVRVRSIGSSSPFDWLTPLLYLLPVPFVLLFIWFVGFKRRKNGKSFTGKNNDTFSGQFGMKHRQMVGKKMLLEIDPGSGYNIALSGFVSEAKASDEALYVLTSSNSALHSVFSEATNLNFLLLTSKAHYPQQINDRETLLPASDLSVILNACTEIQKSGGEKPVNLLFDNISDLVLRCGSDKTYKFTRLLLEAISSSKTTAVFVFIPTAHDQEVLSTIRSLFQNQMSYTKNGPKTWKLYG